MKERRLFLVALILVLLSGQAHFPVLAWGPIGHRWITRNALNQLPRELQRSWSAIRDQIVGACLDADLRRPNDRDEGPRHFVNLERYGDFPFADLDLDADALRRRIGEENFKRNGLVLWTIEDRYNSLVSALRKGDSAAIVTAAADLSHYLSDLHQPFHASLNYNGQLSGQDGIHARVEDDLIQRFENRLKFQPGRLITLPRPVKQASLNIALESWAAVNDLLLADLRIVRELSINRDQHRDERGRPGPYPDAYYDRLFQESGQLIQDRLNLAVQRLASLWWMAWLEAGSPRQRIPAASLQNQRP